MRLFTEEVYDEQSQKIFNFLGQIPIIVISLVNLGVNEEVENMEIYFEEIGDLMSFPILSIESGLTVQEAAQQMHAKNVGAFLVRKGEKYVGIITETDLARKVVALGLDNETTSVSFVMTKTILSMDRYVPIEEAEEFMKQNKVRHLAVTEEDEIVGMLSVKDLVAYYSKAFNMTE